MPNIHITQQFIEKNRSLRQSQLYIDIFVALNIALKLESPKNLRIVSLI